MIKKVLYATLVATVASCGTTRNKSEATTQESSLENNPAIVATAENKVADNNSFWGNLLGEACREMEKENICLSPLSAQFAMAMVANGAEGKTKMEILDAMQLGDNANVNSRRLLDDIATKTVWNEHGDVRIANSIWIKEGFDVKQKFVDTNKEYFDALGHGTHTIEIVWKDGVASTMFEIEASLESVTPENQESPKTGDTSSILWEYVLMVGGMFIALGVGKQKKHIG